MKMRLVNGVWIRLDAPSSRKAEASESSSSMPFASSNEILELLWSLHIKQDNHLGHIQGLENRVDNLVKLDSEFFKVHQ